MNATAEMVLSIFLIDQPWYVVSHWSVCQSRYAETERHPACWLSTLHDTT